MEHDRRTVKPLGGAQEPLGSLVNLVLEQPVALRRRVFEELRLQLLHGHIAPGTRLVESKLAAALGVSRTPIREALHLLELEGLVESQPRVGYRVRSIAWKEVDDILTIRLVNETLAAEWACERMGEAELAGLERNVAASEQALAEGRAQEFVDLDAAFHEALARGSGSQRLLDICQTLRRHMLLFRLVSLWRPEMVGLATRGHGRILEELKARNRAGVRQAMAEHLDDARTTIEGVAQQEQGART